MKYESEEVLMAAGLGICIGGCFAGILRNGDIIAFIGAGITLVGAIAFGLKWRR